MNEFGFNDAGFNESGAATGAAALNYDIVESASFVELTVDNENFITDSATYVQSQDYVVAVLRSIADTGSGADSQLFGWHISVDDSATAATSTSVEAAAWVLDQAAAAEVLNLNAVYSTQLTDGVDVLALLVSGIDELLQDSASSSDSTSADTAVFLYELLTTTGLVTSTAFAAALISELVNAVDANPNGLLELLADSVLSQATHTTEYTGNTSLFDTAAATPDHTGFAVLTSAVIDAASLSELNTYAQVLNAYISEGATFFVNFSVGGEVYTGWVMNTQTGSVSEYQGLNFNSMARIGNSYYAASSTGIHKLVDENSDVHTYIQSGLLDFGTPQYKAATNAYIAADVDGRIAVGVGVSEKTGIAQYWYEVSMDKEAPDNVKLPIGRGLKGRYWKFEVASESMDTFEAMTVLPVVLTRKV